MHANLQIRRSILIPKGKENIWIFWQALVMIRVVNIEYNIFFANSYLMSQHEYCPVHFYHITKIILKPKERRFIEICKFCKVFVNFCTQNSGLMRNNCQMASEQFFYQKRWNLNFIIEKVWAFKLLWCECSLWETKRTFQISNLSFIEKWQQRIRVPFNYKKKMNLFANEEKVKVFNEISFYRCDKWKKLSNIYYLIIIRCSQKKLIQSNEYFLGKFDKKKWMKSTYQPPALVKVNPNRESRSTDTRIPIIPSPWGVITWPRITDTRLQHQIGGWIESKL